MTLMMIMLLIILMKIDDDGNDDDDDDGDGDDDCDDGDDDDDGMHQTDVANYFAFLTNNVLSQSCICSVCPSNLICCEAHKFVINHFISSLN